MGFWDRAAEIAVKVVTEAVKGVAVAVAVITYVGETVIESVADALSRLRKWAVDTLVPKSFSETQEVPISVEEIRRLSKSVIENFIKQFNKLSNLKSKEDYEEYLRLMAVRNLIKPIKEKIDKNAVLKVEDVEIINYCSLILENKDISDEQLVKLDELAVKYKGKRLLTMGVESLLILWQEEKREIEKLDDAQNFNSLSSKTIEIEISEAKVSHLKNKEKKENRLSDEESKFLKAEEIKLENLRNEKAKLISRINDLDFIIGATAGLLVVYEGKMKSQILIKMAEKASQIIVKWQVDKEISLEEREELELFSLTFRHEANEMNEKWRVDNEL